MDLLAESFHLVYYDQRGRGRSFSGKPADDVTMETTTHARPSRHS
jgi:pimeloyl-ACP methyl ester carboxylesterase